MAKLGATVILACRDKQRGAAALAEIRAASGNEKVELMRVEMSVQGEVHLALTALTKGAWTDGPGSPIPDCG